jgi:hypothetical protein
VYQKCDEGLKVVNVHCLYKHAHLCQCVLCLQHFILRNCDEASHEFLLCSYNSECVNIFGRNVCRHKAEGFVVVVKIFYCLKEAFWIWLTCICNVGTEMSYCWWRPEVRFKEMELLCQRNSKRAAGLFLSTQGRQTRYLDTVSATVLVQFCHKMVILPFVLQALKLGIYGSFQNLKAVHTFCNSESSLSLERLLFCFMCFVFWLFLYFVARTVSIVICRVPSSICHAINQKWTY